MQHQATLLSSKDTTLFRCDNCNTEFMSFSRDPKQKCMSCGDKGAYNVDLQNKAELIEKETGKRPSKKQASFSWCEKVVMDGLEYSEKSASERFECLSTSTPKGELVRVQVYVEVEKYPVQGQERDAEVCITVMSKSSVAITTMVLYAVSRKKELLALTGFGNDVKVSSGDFHVTISIPVKDFGSGSKADGLRWVVYS